MSLALRLDRVTAGYQHRRVLNDLTLRVEPGTLTALVGPSGCGKTTVLKVIAGLLQPESGEVWFGDERVTQVAAEKRGIAMVFQKPLLFPHRSVAENVGFGLEMRGWTQERRRAAVQSALTMVQLEGFGGRRPKELSGGQEQRVTLARALVTEPRVLLLDEPLSALDEHLRAEMRGLIRTLQARLAITTVFVTHDQREACEIADEIALMLDGGIAQAGPPRLFFTDPASDAVARFFGWCVIRASSGRLAAFHPSAACLSPATEDQASDDPFLVTIEHVADLGAVVRIAVRMSSGERLELLQVARRDTSNPVPPAGTRARLVVPPSAMRVFSSTGNS